MHYMCRTLLENPSLDDYYKIMNKVPSRSRSENHVLYALQSMAYIYIPHNLCGFLKKNLFDINFLSYARETSSQKTFGLLRDYNNSVIRYSVCLSSMELLSNNKGSNDDMRSSYMEFCDFSKLDLALVYLHKFPNTIFCQIYQRVLKDMSQQPLKNIANRINSMHQVINNELKKKQYKPGFCVKDGNDKFKKKKKRKSACAKQDNKK